MRVQQQCTPLRNEAIKKSSAHKVTMANDDVIYPITSNKDLITVGLALEDDDDMGEDAAAFFGTGSSASDLAGRQC